MKKFPRYFGFGSVRVLGVICPMLCATLLRADAPTGLHHIGSAKQFFFDDEIVETMERTARRLNPAVKVTPNPVIVRDKPWEGPDMRVGYVFFDQRLGRLRMRYSTGVFRTNGRDAKGELIVIGESETS